MEIVASSRSLHRGAESPQSLMGLPRMTVPEAAWSPWSGWERFFVVLACAVFLVLSIGMIRTESLTNNELLFMPAGVSYLVRHDARMDIQEPPLVKIVAALPMLLFQPKIDFNDPSWVENPGGQNGEYFFGAKFFETWNPHHRAMLFAARLPMILLNLLLGLSVYYMARELAGPRGAMLAFALFVTSPFFIAYGSMVHMDVPVAFFSVWTVWFFASLWQDPTRRNALCFGLSLAGALVTKFSGIFLFPAIGLAWVWFKYQSRGAGFAAGAGKDRFKRERLSLGAIMLAAAVVFVIYSATFYQSDVTAILGNEVASNTTTGYHVIPLDVLVRRMTYHPALKPVLLAPSLYIGGLAYVLSHERRPMFFLGSMHAHGVWYYFPVMSALKLPPGMLLMILLLGVLAAVRFLGKRDEKSPLVPVSRRFHLRAIVTCLAVFAGIAMASSLNIGIRHFSVPITLMVLLCSLVVPLARQFSQRWRKLASATTLALACSCLATAALTYPHYLSYFNIFRFNIPKHEIAANSNLNWGQATEELASFFRQRGVLRPYVDVDISTVDPLIYMPDAIDWSCDKPDPAPPAWVAVSTYNLTHQTPNCLRLMGHPSWDIGDGAAMVFQITDKTPMAPSGRR